MRLSEISDRGEHLATLQALRHKLADALDNSNSGRDIASLALQLQKVLTQIDELETEQRTQTPDEIDAAIAYCKARQVRPRRGYAVEYDDDDNL